MKVTVVNESGSNTLPRNLTSQVKKIRAYFLRRRIRNRERLRTAGELTVVFLSEARMKKINKQFRGKNKATDVLSFEGTEINSLGELLLCFPVLKRQAKDAGHGPADETLYMLIHGLLHLLDYDHERSSAEERLMFRLQDRCFEVLKSSPV